MRTDQLFFPGKQKVLVYNEDQAVFAGWLVWWARLALHLASEDKVEEDWQWVGGVHGRKGNPPETDWMGKDATMLMAYHQGLSS